MILVLKLIKFFTFIKTKNLLNMQYNRRRFLKSAGAGLAASVLVSNNILGNISEKQPGYLMSLSNNDESYWEFLKSQFSLRENLLYFNNGSLGPSPEYVIDRTEKYRRTLDAFPSRYMWGGWNEEKENVRELLASFLSVDPETIGLIHNTSEGMNLFAQSFDLKPGDEIILADHEHRTGVAPFEYYCESRGVKLVRPVLPILPSGIDEIVDVYRKAITKKTRLISMVHMTNTNGMILPVKEVSEMAHKKDILVCVDAAQTIGMIRTDLNELGCDFYAASGHKWLWGPKGTGILYAVKAKQDLLKPLMVSNSWKDSNIRMFEDYNTRNLPEVLGLGTAVEFNNIIGQEKKELRIYELKHYFRGILGDDSRFKIKTPEDDSLSAGIQVIEVVDKNVNKAASYLIEEHNIDCRPMTGHKLNALRISLSPFNTKADVDVLVKALIALASS
jgi:isopenicillin-N epimerase